MVFSSLLTALEGAQTVDIITVIEATDERYIGKMLLIHQNKRVEGQLDDFITRQIVDRLQGAEWTKPEVFLMEDQSGGKYRMLWDQVRNKSNAVVFGGGHISQPLVQMLSLLDFIVTVVDDRPEFANRERFPSAQTVICDSFQQSFAQVKIDDNTAVIIVTRGHKYDMACLRATMNSTARYLGMIGSRKRVKEVLAVLKEEGASAELEKRLKAPIGLNINAETPAEIAVSIVAEVIDVFRGNQLGRSLSGREGVRQ